MQLKDIMSCPVLSFHEGVPASDALATMNEAGVRHAVVVRAGDVVGVISERDLGGEHGGASRRHRMVGDCMRSSPIVASPDTTDVAAALFMRDHRIGCVPVVAAGKLVGIVTRSDLLVALASRRRGPVRKRASLASNVVSSPTRARPLVE